MSNYVSTYRIRLFPIIPFQYFQFIIGCLFILNVTGCSHSVDPVDHGGSSGKDPRNYSWTLDTLHYGFQTYIKDIWGINDSLVYAVGHESNAAKGSIWKYDGKHWARIDLLPPVDYNYYTFYAIHGFRENDIYAFGNDDSSTGSSFIRTSQGVHFDGISWKEIELPRGSGIFSLVAPSPFSLYCGGYDGKLYHYDGNMWTVDSVKSTSYQNLPLNVTVIGTTSNKGVYLQTQQWSSFLYSQIIKYENLKYTTLDSAMNEVSLSDRPFWGGRAFWQSENGNIYSCGVGGIFKLSADKWDSFYSTDFIYSVYGANEHRIFAIGKYNIYFFDGTAWGSIRPHNYGPLLSEVHMWCSETQIFITFIDEEKTFILHGK